IKDVAGMVRSFSYAAYAALFGFTVHTPDADATLEGWADAWQHWVSRTFLAAYRGAAGASAMVPDGEAFDVLLDAFVLDKALYEVAYELNNRPDWLRIPL